MKHIASVLIFLFGINAIAQDSLSVEKAADKGTFQVDLAAGLGMYNAFDNIDHARKGFNAAANLYYFKASYMVAPQFSIGAELKKQDYITDESDTSLVIVSASGGSVHITTDYHFSNRKKFNAYVGTGFGVTSFNYTRSYRDSTTLIRGDVFATGPAISFNTGFRWYFVKFLGLFGSASFAMYPMRLKSFTVNGADQEYISYRRVDETIINIRGLEFKVGLSIKI